jgi:ABC-type transport system substrate-binding protein
MAKSPNKNIISEFSEYSIKLQKLRFGIIKFFKESLPIKWELWSKPRVLVKAVSIAPYSLRVVLSISSIILFVSLIATGYGGYLVLTTETAAHGGQVQEAVVTNDLSIFNPILESVSDSETKVSSLLFLPLYYVNYPEFINNTGTSPSIEPVLLQKSPEWIDLEGDSAPDQKYKTLRFTLRNDIYWSNNQPITFRDVQYSFEKLKEDRGNLQFRDVFKTVTIAQVPGNPLEFDLISEKSNPQLIYAANFRPVSVDYFGSQITDRLLSDPRSFKPTVTSGNYTFFDGTISDPDNPRGEKVENPIRNKDNGSIKTVVLNKNPVQNYNPVLIEKYIFRRADRIKSIGGEDDNSVERLTKEGKVDIFVRNLDFDFTSSDVKNTLGLDQVLIKNNTYFNLFLNSQRNTYFYNQTLRKYVICHFQLFNLSSEFEPALSNVESDSRLIPLQLSSKAMPECSENIDDVLDKRFYVTRTDEKTGIKKLLLQSREVEITLVGLPGYTALLQKVQIYFRDMGFNVEIIDDDRAASVITDSNYNALFIPVTTATSDPYSLYGAGGRDLTRLTQSNRFENYNIEENLRNYSISNLQNQEAKNTIVDFFSKEYVSINLFQSHTELNFSNRVKNINNEFPNVITFSGEIYKYLPTWYDQTRRKPIWS